jgi:hypothetical protein
MVAITNCINCINTAIILKKSVVILTRFNTYLFKILSYLQKIHVIESYRINDTSTKCYIYLNVQTNVKKIKCISTSNRLIFYSLKDLIKLRSMDPFNDYVLTINRTFASIQNIDSVIELQRGGLLLLKIIR